MNFFELFLLAIGLAMDALAVAVIIGLSWPKGSIKKALIVGLYFGMFQGIMPLIGYMVASRFTTLIASFSHWIAFAFLAILGGKMIYNTFKDAKSEDNPIQPPASAKETSLAPLVMLPLALAVSVDALAVGVPLAFLYVDIVPAVLFIGVITFIISMAGVRIGNIVGAKFHSKATLAGGIILILMGIWILIERLV